MKDKLVFITGASSGIGESCARIFAKNGSRLILNARNSDKLKYLKKELEEKYSTDVLLLPFDVRNRQQLEQCISEIPQSYKDIDVLVNNAGLALGLDKEHEGDIEDYLTMIDTNIKGLLCVTRQIVPEMVKRNKGHIINIGSVAGDTT